MGIIALLTDFGDSEYVGIMKGVLCREAPGVTVVDLHHGIPPQDIRAGAWVLLQGYRYFPPDTVFLAVVDPGVGSGRRALAVATVAGPYFVGPDNGLLYPAVAAAGVAAAVTLPTPAGASATFHGRDLFAPAAARLAAGQPLASLGAPAGSLCPLVFHLQDREGELVRVDRFGNLVTNLPPLPGRTRYQAAIGAFRGELELVRTYADLPPDQPGLVVSSAGTLEVAVRNGSAAAFWGQPLHTGTRVYLG